MDAAPPPPRADDAGEPRSAGAPPPAESDVLSIGRGAPLLATWPRWAAFVLGEAAVVVGFGALYLSLTRSKQTLADLALPMGGALALAALLTYAMLRAEEARLARELRTARQGTAAIRAMVLRRRERAPMLLRMLSTSLGTAAVLLAEGERAAAMDAVGATSPLMSGGRLGRLRAILDADIDRATKTPATLERCVRALRELPPTGNTEADRYRTHVLAKAILEAADGDAAEEACAALAQSPDEEQRIYAVWLRAWFEIDSPPPPEGELRLALLLARSHGAEELAKKLEEELSGLRPPAAPAT